MTAPRQILPGATHLVTRRCSERRFFLRPSRVVNAMFLYVLALAARRHGILVHAFCVLSNHYHLLVTDPFARLPRFVQDLDSLVARALNAVLGHWEGFWSSEGSYSLVTPATRDDIAREAAYVLANPVAAGLVSDGRDWPGLRSDLDELGSATLTAPRPEVLFNPRGDQPAYVELRLTPPPGFASASEWRRGVAAALRPLEERARCRVAAAGRRFLGRARVLAQSPFGRPTGREPRRRLNPRIAARDPGERIEALARLVGFLRAYREAWVKLKSGVHDAVFPAGTYHLRVEHGVRCAAFG